MVFLKVWLICCFIFCIISVVTIYDEGLFLFDEGLFLFDEGLFLFERIENDGIMVYND